MVGWEVEAADPCADALQWDRSSRRRIITSASLWCHRTDQEWKSIRFLFNTVWLNGMWQQLFLFFFVFFKKCSPYFPHVAIISEKHALSQTLKWDRDTKSIASWTCIDRHRQGLTRRSCGGVNKYIMHSNSGSQLHKFIPERTKKKEMHSSLLCLPHPGSYGG